MHTQRIGKIARLPFAVREELNRRLLDGESGAQVLRWINELPEVREILRVEFRGKAIAKQNLWAWRKGGYRDWLMRRDAMELAARLGEEVEAAGKGRMQYGGSMTEMMARWVAVQFAVASWYVVSLRGKEHWRSLRQMVTEVVKLRGAEQDGQRLRLQERKAGVEEKKLAFRRACWVARNGKSPSVEKADGAEMPGMERVMEEMRREFFPGMGKEEFWEKVTKEDEVEGGDVGEAPVKAGQGESRFAQEDAERDSTQRLEDSKEGAERTNVGVEKGSPPRRQDAKVAGVAASSDPGGSKSINEGEESGSPRRYEDTKEEVAGVVERGHEGSKGGWRQVRADDLFRRETALSLASQGARELSFGEMTNREVKIYCPRCSWEPEQASRWSCHCGCVWNTFDTGGVCPDCGKVWEDTACLSCHSWSRHRDWYHEFIGGREVESVEVTRELERTI